jgi:hypothetical protein
VQSELLYYGSHELGVPLAETEYLLCIAKISDISNYSVGKRAHLQGTATSEILAP